MAPSKKEAIALIVDIRKSDSEECLPDVTFTKVKECAKKIILRKIISKSKDDIALIVLGSEFSNNSVDHNLSYDYIEVVQDLEHPSWNTVKNCTAGAENPTDCGGDVLEAFVVAMSILRKSQSAYAALKIVLISHACGSSNIVGLDIIIDHLKSMTVQVTVIGPNIAERTESQTNGMDVDGSTEWGVVARIAVETGGLVCRFEDALEQLTNFERKKVKVMPWKAGLEIGPELTIPVFGVIKVSPSDDIKAKILRVSGEDRSHVERDYIYTVQSATSDEKDVAKEEIIDGYNFGSTIVPFSADEKAVLGYQSGPRSMKLLYFTDAKNVPKHLYVGSGEYYFFPNEDVRSQAAFSAFVKGMAEGNVVAIVRRIYNNNNNPTLGILSPKIREKYMCLVYVALPYAGDVKHLSFGPLTTKKTKPTAEQCQAVDELISKMDLMEVVDEDGEFSEAFRPKATLDPSQQYLYEVICDRALNEKNEEILKPSEHILKMLAPPSEIQQRINPVLDKIKRLFPLVEKKPKEGTRKAAVDVFKQENVDLKADQVQDQNPKVVPSKTTKIGTLTPVQDFQSMLEENEIPFNDVCEKMQDVIWNCVENAFDLDDMKRPLLLVQTLRAVCVKQDPSIFNAWITKLKNELPSSKRSFLKLLVDENAALITREESERSSVSKEEAEELLCEEAAEIKEETAGDDNLDDLLNDL